MEVLVDLIDDIKRDIPDQKYIEIMGAMSKIYDSKEAGTEKIETEGMIVEKNVPDFGFINITWKDREDGPSSICYRNNGKIFSETWKKEGKLHRGDGKPSVIQYYDGKIISESWYKEGNRHREEGPAQINFDNEQICSEFWYRDGELHREGGPAMIQYGDRMILFECWYNEGKLHREGGPALIYYYKNGQIRKKEWYKEGIKERTRQTWPFLGLSTMEMDR